MKRSAKQLEASGFSTRFDDAGNVLLGVAATDSILKMPAPLALALSKELAKAARKAARNRSHAGSPT